MIFLLPYLIIAAVIIFIARKYELISFYTPASATKDTSMYSAVLVKSDTCPFCTKQLEILDQYGLKAYERIKVLDSEKDAAEIEKIVGDYSSVPTWFNPISGDKTSGVKTVQELINMGILF